MKPIKMTVAGQPVPHPLPEPKRATDQLQAALHGLGHASGDLKRVLRPMLGDLDAETERFRLMWRQAEPGWQGKQMTNDVSVALNAIEMFIDALAEATELTAELAPILDAATEQLARDRAMTTLVTHMELLDEYEKKLARTKRTFHELQALAKDSEKWVPVAKVSAGRITRAAVRVIRAGQIEQTLGRLDRLDAERAKVRSSVAVADGELDALITLAEQLTEKALPLPVIRWDSDEPRPTLDG